LTESTVDIYPKALGQLILKFFRKMSTRNVL